MCHAEWEDEDKGWCRGDAPALKLSRNRTLRGVPVRQPYIVRTSCRDMCSHVELEGDRGSAALQEQGDQHQP